MSIQVTDRNDQALSNFISISPWDDAPLVEQIGTDATRFLSSAGANALILDESGVAKQGKASVGVARQYCGASGKVDNCQIGMFLAYSSPEEATLIDRRLFLPREWTRDQRRCERAGIPISQRTYKTKAELGLEMILKARDRGIAFEFVGMDAHYGEQPWFLTRLDREGITFVGDVPETTPVYLEYPEVGIPPRTGKRGRGPTKLRVLRGNPVEVRSILPSLEWHVLTLRDTQRGELRIRFAAIRVWRVEDKLPCLRPVWLLVRQELDGSETKYSFCNAAFSTPLQTLAEWHSRRYWVERAIQDAKGLAGLDEYQVIGWRGWHHHTAMVLLAMLFLLKLKHDLRPKAPMITLQDALEILEVVMPKKHLSEEEAIALIAKKHLNRFRSRNSRLKSTMFNSGLPGP